MVPPPPIARYTRGLHMPVPTEPVSAIRSPVWRAEHQAEPLAASASANPRLRSVAA
jgi:hypothetical protein